MSTTTPGSSSQSASKSANASPGKSTNVERALSTKGITTFTCGGARLSDAWVIFRAPAPASTSDTGKVLDAILRAKARETKENYASPKNPWVLAFCDTQGILGPPGFPCNPADTYKLTRKGRYEIVFVNHPSLELAKDLTHRLNNDPRIPDVPIKVFEIPESGIVDVPLDPGSFTPPGPPQYGGYCLFERMPLRNVPSIREHVVKLQADLGRLRYVVGGIAGDPYLPCETTEAKRKTSTEWAAEPLRGDFSKLTMNDVYDFQHQAIDSALWKLPGKPKNPWDYVDPVEVRGQPLGHKPDAVPEKADGVVDVSTANAISDALAKDMRRPGHILVPVEAVASAAPPHARGTWQSWLRSDVAEAFWAWDALLRALGSPYGVSFGHSFRSAFDAMNPGGPAPGKAVKSYHKTGLAIDLVMDGWRPGAATFPVVAIREPGDTWRLYIASNQPLPGDDAEAEAAKLRDEIRKPLAKKPTPRHLYGYPAAAQKVLDALRTPETFFADFYRAEITPWIYEETLTGGYAEPPRKPPPGFASWLDVTRVAKQARLQPIPPNNGWKGKEAKKCFLPLADLLRGTYDSYLRLAVKNEEAVAAHLANKRAADPSSVPEAPPSRLVHLTRGKDSPGAGTTAVPVTAAKLDLLLAWGKKLNSMAGKGISGLIIKTPLLLLTLPAREKAPVLDEARKLLTAPELAAQPFWGKHDDEATVLTGAEWADKLVAIHAAMITPATQTDGSVGTAEPRIESYTVALSPVFSMEPEPTTLGPCDIANVMVDYSRCQEWWHFESEDAPKRWFEHVMALGWRRECLLAAPVEALYGRTGVGYEP